MMLSYGLQAFWMYMLAGLGEKSNKTPTESNAIVASFMLFSFSYNVSACPDVPLSGDPSVLNCVVPADGPRLRPLRHRR